jgi:hypothetical protein
MVVIDAQLDRLSMSSINCDAGKCMGSKKQIRVSSKHLMWEGRGGEKGAVIRT